MASKQKQQELQELLEKMKQEMVSTISQKESEIEFL